MRPAAVLAVPALALSALALAACSSEPIVVDPNPAPRVATGPNDFTSTGQMPCSALEPTLEDACPYGITVAAGGTAVLHVVNPAAEPEGIQRLLFYREGVWTTLDGATVGARREGGATLLSVDEREFYAVPHEALTG